MNKKSSKKSNHQQASSQANSGQQVGPQQQLQANHQPVTIPGQQTQFPPHQQWQVTNQAMTLPMISQTQGPGGAATGAAQNTFTSTSSSTQYYSTSSQSHQGTQAQQAAPQYQQTTQNQQPFQYQPQPQYQPPAPTVIAPVQPPAQQSFQQYGYATGTQQAPPAAMYTQPTPQPMQQQPAPQYGQQYAQHYASTISMQQPQPAPAYAPPTQPTYASKPPQPDEADSFSTWWNNEGRFTSKARQVVQQAPAAPDYSQLQKAPPPPPTSQQMSVTTTTTRKQTMVYESCESGGEARNAARAQGRLAQFDDKVQSMIDSLGGCPSRYKWYPIEQGYICGDGNHVVSHDDIDAWSRNSRVVPDIMLVNSWNSLGYNPETGMECVYCVHPPNVDAWQPMHKQHRDFVEHMAGIGWLPLREDSNCKCFERMGVPTWQGELAARSRRVAWDSSRRGPRSRRIFEDPSEDDDDLTGRFGSRRERSRERRRRREERDDDTFEEFFRPHSWREGGEDAFESLY